MFKITVTKYWAPGGSVDSVCFYRTSEELAVQLAKREFILFEKIRNNLVNAKVEVYSERTGIVYSRSIL